MVKAEWVLPCTKIQGTGNEHRGKHSGVFTHSGDGTGNEHRGKQMFLVAWMNAWHIKSFQTQRKERLTKCSW